MIQFDNKSFKRKLLSASLLTGVGVIFVPGAALAQGADVSVVTDQAQIDDVDTVQAITVTGSRLRRDSNLDSPSPVESIDAAALRGAPDVTDVLRTLPALTASVTSAQSIAPGELGSGGAVGAATLNLRGMGAERTLVLVNGRRHVAGVAETSVVDINSIPRALIQKVEVLTGGASAVYGADAVTGVVNFILDRTFDGLEIGVTGATSDRWDGQTMDGYIKWGKNFKDGRGNLTMVGEYNRDFGARFGDRAQFRDGNIASNGPNPALRFQRGDLGANTPNFSNFFNIDNGFFPFGFVIPTPGSGRFNAIFPTGTTPTGSELDL